ncbi:class F sortase [Arthrobacter sp. UKPF54-2]|uniref:class F sortase n=1 Tax=Arthrobacter sp. UKPF54-2 TaxID=2600159 RepID=UPI0011B18E7F|nr:class F sortase [Arthrobacter sp. UKPF54-2]QDY90792.1 class F sortase [Arthrobacter sp. UKPF54-2]
MASHRKTPRFRAAGNRGLLLSARDILVLAVCALGIVAAWLTYGAGVIPDAGAAAVGRDSGTSTPAPPHQQSGGPAAKAPVVLPAGAAAAGKSAAPAVPVLPAASVPLRISFPAAGMDVAVHPLEPGRDDTESRSIVPPETKDGYWLAPFGTPGAGSTNTTYIVGHSWLDQDAPFNHLSTQAAPGDVLTVTTATGVLRYRVDSVTTYSKATLKDSGVWEAVANRLVLISCYTEDPWGRNVVVVASPLKGS